MVVPASDGTVGPAPKAPITREKIFTLIVMRARSALNSWWEKWAGLNAGSRSKRVRTALAATPTETPAARAWHVTPHSVTTSWQTGDETVGGTDRPLRRFSGSIFRVDPRVAVPVRAPSPALVALLCAELTDACTARCGEPRWLALQGSRAWRILPASHEYLRSVPEHLRSVPARFTREA